MSMFSSMFAPKPAASQVPQPAQAPAQGAPAAPQGQMPGSSQTPPNPLDAYAKIFEPAKDAPETPPTFSIDPKTLNDVSGSLDFTKSVNPELMQKAMTGDAQSMIQMMNMVGQQAYQAALSHSSSLTDRFVGARSEFDKKQIGSGVKKELTSQALSSIPNYSHPVVRNQLNMLAGQIAAANPEYAPEQVAQTAQKMLQDLASAISPQQQQEDSQQSKETDWVSYLTKPSNL